MKKYNIIQVDFDGNPTVITDDCFKYTLIHLSEFNVPNNKGWRISLHSDYSGQALYCEKEVLGHPVISISELFSGNSIRHIKRLDLRGMDVSNVIDFSNLCTHRIVVEIDISTWDISKGILFKEAFISGKGAKFIRETPFIINYHPDLNLNGTFKRYRSSNNQLSIHIQGVENKQDRAKLGVGILDERYKDNGKRYLNLVKTFVGLSSNYLEIVCDAPISVIEEEALAHTSIEKLAFKNIDCLVHRKYLFAIHGMFYGADIKILDLSDVKEFYELDIQLCSIKNSIGMLGATKCEILVKLHQDVVEKHIEELESCGFEYISGEIADFDELRKVLSLMEIQSNKYYTI